MPPSGFVSIETATLESVARSLLCRFEEEVKSGLHASREEGITHELGIITMHQGAASDVERGVLSFAEGIYLALKAGKTVDEIACDLRALESKKYK